MDKSVAQALTGLIPSLSGPLPQELVELAVSLLAQSRNKASSLKAEEEIARSLKLNLDLPKIEPRPPCPPRIYQKLYKFLDGALTAGTRRSGRPTRPSEILSTPTSSPAKPRTPAKSTLVKAATTPRRKGNPLARVVPEVPKWVLPTIRHLCKTLGAPAAPHHVFAGVSSILTLPSPRSDDENILNSQHGDEDIPALIIVVTLLVITRLSGEKMAAEEFIRLRGLAIIGLRNSGVKEVDQEVADDDKVTECVANWMREIGVKGWTELDWFDNVGEGTGLDIASHDARKRILGNNVGAEDDEIDDPKTISILENVASTKGDEDDNHLRSGLGTMMQDRVDYLSESRVREYQAWKKVILERCDELRKAQR